MHIICIILLINYKSTSREIATVHTFFSRVAIWCLFLYPEGNVTSKDDAHAEVVRGVGFCPLTKHITSVAQGIFFLL